MPTVGAGGHGDGGAGGSGSGGEGPRDIEKSDEKKMTEVWMQSDDTPPEPENTTPRVRATLPRWKVRVVEGTGPRPRTEAVRTAAVRLASRREGMEDLATTPRASQAPLKVPSTAFIFGGQATAPAPVPALVPTPAPAPVPTPARVCCCGDDDDAERPEAERATVIAIPFRRYPRLYNGPRAPPFDADSAYWKNLILEEAAEAYSAFFRRRGVVRLAPNIESHQVMRNMMAAKNVEMGEEVVDDEEATSGPHEKAPDS